VNFKPFSKYPICYKDVSFFDLSSNQTNQHHDLFQVNDFFDLCRQEGGEMIEEIKLSFEIIVHHLFYVGIVG